MLGLPHGGTVHWTAAKAAYEASSRHEVVILDSHNSGPNYNALWVEALNRCHKEDFQRFVMLHADIQLFTEVETGLPWLDVLEEERATGDFDFISVPSAIKDPRGLTSCGIGDPDNEWNPWRRFCINEWGLFKQTFTAQEIGYGDKYLLHNHACCMWDMTKQALWQQRDKNGDSPFVFNLTERIRWNEATQNFRRDFKSEDWDFSRALWKAGVRTALTSRLTLDHHGGLTYRNKGYGGSMRNGDDDTAPNWRKPGAPGYAAKAILNNVLNKAKG